MTFKPSGWHPYLDQLLMVGTKGNVTATYALHVDRMMLHCKVCDQTLTTGIPKDSATEIDYSMQEYIKIHAHIGGHVAGPKCNCGGPKTGPEGTYGQSHHTWCPAYVYVKPVTLDFKDITPLVNKAVDDLMKKSAWPFATEVDRVKRDIIRQALKTEPEKPKKGKLLKIATGRKFR